LVQLLKYKCGTEALHVFTISAVNPSISKHAQERTIVGLQYYDDWYTGARCYIWYSKEEPRCVGHSSIASSLYQM